jgi:transposase
MIGILINICHEVVCIVAVVMYLTKVDEVLEKYSLTRENVVAYIDAIVRSNQTDTAEAMDVSRDTVNRYKKAFESMTEQERLLVVSALTQERLLEIGIDGD